MAGLAYFGTKMRTCSLSAAKGSLGKLADDALRGRPTMIPRGGKLVILQAYNPPDLHSFDDLIQAGRDSAHRPLTAGVLTEIWKRGRRLARRGRLFSHCCARGRRTPTWGLELQNSAVYSGCTGSVAVL
jgi:hypothetical protein